jgi:hypothetical protein
MRNVYVDFGEHNLIGRAKPNGNTIYLDGICYKDEFIKSGKKCRFLWSEDKDYGYKIFTNNPTKNIPPNEETVRLVFSIQKLLFEGGYSPEPYEVIRCEDKLQEYFAIKMETIKGKVPMDGGVEWAERLKKYCRENKIFSQFTRLDTTDLDLGLDRNGKIHPDSTNCILSDKDNKIYLVDVDIRFRIG